GQRVAFGISGERMAHPGTLVQIVIGIDMDNLVERAEIGVPEGAERRVFDPRGESLRVTLLKFRDGASTQGVGADFVYHRRSSMGVGGNRPAARGGAVVFRACFRRRAGEQ